MPAVFAPAFRARTSQAANDTTAQVRQLRSAVESVMRNTVTPALADAFERAATATEYTTERARRHSETVADNVRGRPLIAIALAAAVGFLFGRVTR
jgi:ElaB/YqjD/DUF883 family membrane-anchored ribosome-binding protein